MGCFVHDVTHRTPYRNVSLKSYDHMLHIHGGTLSFNPLIPFWNQISKENTDCFFASSFVATTTGITHNSSWKTIWERERSPLQLPLCRSLGSVSDGPAQWKTLLDLTQARAGNTHLKGCSLSYDCPVKWEHLKHMIPCRMCLTESKDRRPFFLT